MHKLSKLSLKFILFFIRLSQILISPLKPPSCRFFPTCSGYAHEAIKLYGYQGLIMAIKRILRCHPFGKNGYDPVSTHHDYKG